MQKNHFSAILLHSIWFFPLTIINIFFYHNFQTIKTTNFKLQTLKKSLWYYFTFRAFLSYLEQFFIWMIFQTVHKPAFLNRTVPVTRIGGCSFNTYHWLAPSGVYMRRFAKLLFYSTRLRLMPKDTPSKKPRGYRAARRRRMAISNDHIT